MGLITKEVEVVLNGSNIKHFESLGYNIPRRYNGRNMAVPKGMTIKVKTNDLKPTSKVLVDIECDCCKKVLNLGYEVYVRYNRDGKYYCNNCVHKLFLSGSNNPRWKPDKTDAEREDDRSYPEYLDFIKRVLARDNCTCQCCGNSKSNTLDVHHLDGYNWCIEKRTDETNAVVLCKTCHGNFHSLYGMGNNTKEQYEEWIGYAIGELKKYNGALPIARKVFDYERNMTFESAQQYAETFDVDVKSVRQCCNHYEKSATRKNKKGIVKTHTTMVNTVKNHHLFWVDEYENMTKEEIMYFINKPTKRVREVICLTTGEYFKTFSEASEKYGTNIGSMCSCCTGKLKSSGKLPDGTPLQWMYYSDFLKLSIEEQNKILAKNQESLNNDSFIIQ